MASNISVVSGLQIKNSWAGAGIASFVHIVSVDKSVNILFDCGTVEPSTLSATHVFCTHGHMDHIGGCVSHARSRGLHGKKATYFVPECCKEGLLEQKAACEKMDGQEIPMNVRTCKPGEFIRLSKQFRVRAFRTEHRVPSQGYAVYYQPPATLKEEFIGRSTEEMRELARGGAQLKDVAEEVLQLVYTGDSTFRGLCSEDNRFLFSAPILIMECTYLTDLSSTAAASTAIAGSSRSRSGKLAYSVDDSSGDSNGHDQASAGSLTLSAVAGDHAKALEYGHIHLDDVIRNAHLFDQVQYLVFVHLSMKYQPYYRALEIFRAVLPPELLAKSFSCLKALGSANYVTKLALTPSGGRSAGSSRSPSPSNPSSRARGVSGEARKRREEDEFADPDCEKKVVGYGWGSYKRTVRRGPDGEGEVPVSVKQAVRTLSLSAVSGVGDPLADSD